MSIVSTAPARSPEEPSHDLRLSEVIGALSYALDITEGQPEGHAARSCLLGMRIAREINLPAAESSALFYALLLKDLGCSSNASKVCYLFGTDDRVAKQNLKRVDWTSFTDSMGYVARNVTPDSSWWRKAAQFAKVAIAGQSAARELVQLRCERGAKIARELNLPELSAEAIRSLDEHWDGSGHPDGLRGAAIPRLSRILCLAQTIEVFAKEAGPDAACEIARQRSGSWFDPDLVEAVSAFQNDAEFWKTFVNDDPREAIATFEPPDESIAADEATLDRIAFGFAQVIDAKSPWTFKHSEGVSQIAAGIAQTLGIGAHDTRLIRRAGLLHDIGKLGISNLILDKPGKLTQEEQFEMRKHPAYTFHILDRVAGFRGLAAYAAAHHERLDGNGYHLGLIGEQICMEARILAVADMYEALTARRPYREDLGVDKVTDILESNLIGGICPEVYAALKTYLANGGYIPAPVAA